MSATDRFWVRVGAVLEALLLVNLTNALFLGIMPLLRFAPFGGLSAPAQFTLDLTEQYFRWLWLPLSVLPVVAGIAGRWVDFPPWVRPVARAVALLAVAAVMWSWAAMRVAVELP